ncbi:unnamed protein product [Nesidiocoris tenuis]|uniref:Uncharacterized protein n=1 Tax=Nesidiocoris tenuis TaxID=355587 RepID=A0A6H5GMB3_9HEMI|nr:unnamed protein product [Nesidiocoris tenuis]
MDAQKLERVAMILCKLYPIPVRLLDRRHVARSPGLPQDLLMQMQSHVIGPLWTNIHPWLEFAWPLQQLVLELSGLPEQTLSKSDRHSTSKDMGHGTFFFDWQRIVCVYGPARSARAVPTHHRPCDIQSQLARLAPRPCLTAGQTGSNGRRGSSHPSLELIIPRLPFFAEVNATRRQNTQGLITPGARTIYQTQIVQMLVNKHDLLMNFKQPRETGRPPTLQLEHDPRSKNTVNFGLLELKPIRITVIKSASGHFKHIESYTESIVDAYDSR